MSALPEKTQSPWRKGIENLRLPVVLVRIQRLVAGSVTFDSFLEVHHGFGFVTVLVVWTGNLDFLYGKENC